MWQIVNRFCYGTDKCGLEEFERSCAFLKLIGDKYGVHVEFISRLDELYLETTPSFAEANWLYCGECKRINAVI